MNNTAKEKKEYQLSDSDSDDNRSSGMSIYVALNNQYISSEEEEEEEEEEKKLDKITYEKLRISSVDPHPRCSMSILRTNDKPYYYNTETLFRIITSGDKKDPFTRQPIKDLDIYRIHLYHQSLILFPDITIQTLNIKQVYNDWISNPDDKTCRIKAEAFLQPSDIIGLFRAYDGNGSGLNRQQAEKELTEKPVRSWILRNVSIKNTKYISRYGISIKTSRKNKFSHLLILHKFGSGFHVANNSFPTIIDLIYYIIYRLKKVC
jgi:hypothetical protein